MCFYFNLMESRVLFSFRYCSGSSDALRLMSFFYSLNLLNSLNECILSIYPVPYTPRRFIAWLAHMVPSELLLCLSFVFFLFIFFSSNFSYMYVELHYEIYLLPKGARWHSFTWNIVFGSYLICSSITTFDFSFSFWLNNDLVIIIGQEMFWSNFMWRIWKLITQYAMIGDCNLQCVEHLCSIFFLVCICCECLSVCVCVFSFLL